MRPPKLCGRDGTPHAPVNVWMIVGVMLFLAAGALATTYWAWTSSPGETRSTRPPAERISSKL